MRTQANFTQIETRLTECWPVVPYLGQTKDSLKHIKANRLTRYTSNWSNAITQFHKNHHDIEKKTVLVYAEGLNIEQDFRTFGLLGQTQILVWSGIGFEICLY